MGKTACRCRRLPLRKWRERWYPRNVSVWVSRSGYVLAWASRTGFVYSMVCGLFHSVTADGQRSEIWAAIHEGPMKRKERAKITGGLSHASDDNLAKRFPLLHEWMTSARFEDGAESREAPTVTLWAQGGQWRLSLRDRAECLVLWLVGDTVLEVLKLAESFCQDESGPWRVDDHTSPSNGKRLRRS